MPMYEFICAQCGERFELLARESPDCPACPHCGAGATQRLVSAPSPLKKGAFPFKPGPVHPLAGKMAGSAGNACASCHKSRP